ncbi:MAG: hypothetical protein QXQ39_03870 [Conexivisphaerales archaeon]
MSDEYILNMRIAKNTSRYKRASKSVRVLRGQVARFKHINPDEVKIDTEVNEFIWSKGIRNSISKLKIEIVTDEEGSLTVKFPSKETVKEEQPPAEEKQENKEQISSK